VGLIVNQTNQFTKQKNWLKNYKFTDLVRFELLKIYFCKNVPNKKKKDYRNVIFVLTIPLK